jgi:hypothetical protein
MCEKNYNVAKEEINVHVLYLIEIIFGIKADPITG